jgi:hypothetical protein
MDPARAPGTPPKSIVFQDGLGERRRISDVSGADTIEQLCLRGELTAIPSFEFALRERASRLANFRHVYYGRVRSVDRLSDPSSTLAVVSDSIKGVRLANLLAASERRPQTLDISASVHLIRQVVAAVAMLHETARDVAHGAVGPERIIVTPNARVVIVEYVLGAALEQLHFSQERYWKELRIALPPSHGLPRFDHRADVTAIGVVALSLVMGRLLHDDEYPAGVGDVLNTAWAISAKGDLEPLPPGLKTWITRALQLDPRRSFATAVDAREELDRVLSDDDEEDEAETASAALEVAAPAAKYEPPRSTPRYDAPAPIYVPPSSTYERPYVKKESLFSKPENPPARAETKPDVPELKTETAPASVEAPLSKTDSPASLSGSSSSPLSWASTVRSSLPRSDEPAKTPFPPPTQQSWSASISPAPIEDDAEETESYGLAISQLPWKRLTAAAATVVIIAAGGYAARRFVVSSANASAPGTLNIDSNPPGAQVLVDGQGSGVTPITLTLKPGPHNVELRGAGDPRTIPVTIAAGTQASQYIELPKGVTAFGQLQVTTQPAGAQVTVDGIPRGKSPVLVESLAAGDHSVALEYDGSNLKQTVAVEAGMTASLVVPLAPAETAPAPGWISIAAPVELQVFENKRLIGTSQSDRLMITAGRHDIEIINEALGYRQVRTIQVPAGRVTPIKLEWPKGSVAINALPWADVWIDGERAGETPIGNLSLPIGPHEIVFRHPELGEQRFATTVSLKAPARVSVDLRKK